MGGGVVTWDFRRGTIPVSSILTNIHYSLGGERTVPIPQPGYGPYRGRSMGGGCGELMGEMISINFYPPPRPKLLEVHPPSMPLTEAMEGGE